MTNCRRRLPTRQHADRRVLRGGVEPELLEQRLVLVVGLTQRAGHQLAHRDVGIERRRVLVGVSDDDRRARRDRPSAGARRPAMMSSTWSCRTRSGRRRRGGHRFDDEVDAVEDGRRLAAIGRWEPLADIDEFDHLIAEPSRSGASSRSWPGGQDRGPPDTISFAVRSRALGFDVRAGAPRAARPAPCGRGSCGSTPPALRALGVRHERRGRWRTRWSRPRPDG